MQTNMEEIIKETDIELYSPASYEVIHAQQGDNLSRSVRFSLYNQGQEYNISDNVSVTLEGHRGDNSSFPRKNCEVSGNTVTVKLDSDILYAPGIAEARIVMRSLTDDSILSTIPFKIHVQKDPCDKNKIESEKGSLIDGLAQEINHLKKNVSDHLADKNNPHEVTDVLRAEQLKTARNIDGVSFKGHSDISHYGVCQTSSAAAAKEVSITGFSLVTGARINVLFSNANTAASPTLNVNRAGARSIYYDNKTLNSSNAKILDGCCELVYNGSVWQLSGNYTMVKGAAESVYRKNLVNLTPQNLGALPVKKVTQAEYNALSSSEKANGTIYYIPDADNSIPNASVAAPGLMSASDKSKLDGIAQQANNYSLPLASSGARGGVKTGYSQNGKNYPVQLSSERMYVNVPWTDTHAVAGVKGNAETSYRTGNVNITPSNIGLGNVANERQYSASNPQPSVTGSSGSCTGNAATATKWSAARTINGMSIDGSASRTNYGACYTSASTAAKTVSCTGFSLATGAEITVKFSYTNTAANPTLNVNSTGAKPVYYRGSAIKAAYLAANRTYSFRYNGSQYELVGDIDTANENAGKDGDGNDIASTYVKNTDSRLTNARTPTAHTHDDRYYTEAEINAKLSGLFATQTFHYPSAVTVNSNAASGTLVFNVAKTGYTPIGFIGASSGQNGLAVTQFTIVNGATAYLRYKNTKAETVTIPANTVYISVGYVKTSL